jgi:hypothetical protein
MGKSFKQLLPGLLEGDYHADVLDNSTFSPPANVATTLVQGGELEVWLCPHITFWLASIQLVSMLILPSLSF